MMIVLENFPSKCLKQNNESFFQLKSKNRSIVKRMTKAALHALGALVCVIGAATLATLVLSNFTILSIALPVIFAAFLLASAILTVSNKIS